MAAAALRLEEGRSEHLRPPAHLEAAEPDYRDPRPSLLPWSRQGTAPPVRRSRRSRKREVTGLYESGAGPTRRECRAGGEPALSEVRPGPVVLRLPGPAGTGQVALRGLPAARRVPGRRGRAERALGCLGRRDLRAWRRRPAQAAAGPSRSEERRVGKEWRSRGWRYH